MPSSVVLCVNIVHSLFNDYLVFYVLFVIFALLCFQGELPLRWMAMSRYFRE